MAVAPKKDNIVDIPPVNLVRIVLRIEGTAPYVQHKFSAKAQNAMEAKQRAGSTGKATRKREPRNFETDFKAAQHVSTDGWIGIPATAFRAAMIDACRTVSLVMTRAKMAIFIVADGFDDDDGTPLVRLHAPAPKMHRMIARNETGVADIRVRPMWPKWEAFVTVEYDADILTTENIVNLLDRAGRQVGIGEGRPFSKQSVGQGWGMFQVTAKAVEDEQAA